MGDFDTQSDEFKEEEGGIPSGFHEVVEEDDDGEELTSSYADDFEPIGAKKRVVESEEEALTEPDPEFEAYLYGEDPDDSY